MPLPKFEIPMQDVENLLKEKYASGQPPGPPAYVADAFNKSGGNVIVHWRGVRAMKATAKVEVQRVLDGLSERYDLGKLTLAKDNRYYVAMQDNGTAHPAVEIVTKNHRGVVVLFDDEEVEL